MNQAIFVNNLWKKYKIGQPKKLTEALPLFLLRQRLKEFWALKGVDIFIDKGDRIGIVGANGSGKSTLLKVIAGVTMPSVGTVKVDGKLVSLLEIGIGFHPEFTGRENIYLYGSILGLEPREIKKRYDQIVNFSEIKKFLDTPVKYYSSGMYLRLAFSVAIHLDWDVLLVDEVLTVGDIDFQQKCIEKIESLLSDDKTLVLVSHNLDLIRKLCTRAIFLEDGRIRREGSTDFVCNYFSDWISRQ